MSGTWTFLSEILKEIGMKKGESWMVGVKYTRKGGVKRQFVHKRHHLLFGQFSVLGSPPSLLPFPFISIFVFSEPELYPMSNDVTINQSYRLYSLTKSQRSF